MFRTTEPSLQSPKPAFQSVGEGVQRCVHVLPSVWVTVDQCVHGGQGQPWVLILTFHRRLFFFKKKKKSLAAQYPKLPSMNSSQFSTDILGLQTNTAASGFVWVLGIYTGILTSFLISLTRKGDF